MKRMKLKDSEFDDVFVGEEDILKLAKLTRWLVIARVHTTKTFNAEAFKDT